MLTSNTLWWCLLDFWQWYIICMISLRLSDPLHIAIHWKGNNKSWHGITGLFIILWFAKKKLFTFLFVDGTSNMSSSYDFFITLFILDLDFKFSQNVTCKLKFRVFTFRIAIYVEILCSHVFDCHIRWNFVFSHFGLKGTGTST